MCSPQGRVEAVVGASWAILSRRKPEKARMPPTFKSECWQITSAIMASAAVPPPPPPPILPLQ
eukprot:5864545-Pyramimonas_sp.AAC.1